MLPDLKEWKENRPEDTPKLLLVSAGTEEANSQMSLSSTVVLDQQFAVGRSFGASGTPSAVLIDAEGKIASELFISECTVATHLGRVFKKLEVHSREQVAELFAGRWQARGSA